jgi:FkbM family methyltransferase
LEEPEIGTASSSVAGSRSSHRPTLAVVTGYVQIPGHPRSDAEYDLLGSQLGALRAAPVRVFRCALEDCWLHEHVRDRHVEHAVSDNPKKNSLAYHVVQHQKTAWLTQALETDPRAEVLVWIDYGIFHQRGVTAEVIDDFLRRIRAQPEIAIPGCTLGPSGSFEQPDWRFCGSSLVVPRDLVRGFHEAVREVTLERIATTARVTWEINDWAEVERRKMVPIRWYAASHDLTQFTNYRTDEASAPVVPAREVRYTYDPARGSSQVAGFPAVVLSYRAEGTPHIVPGVYERDLIDWAKQLAPAGKQFVDCGAHMGSWTVLMAAHFREVHAFEPQRLIFQQLCGNVALNGLTNVFAYNVGLDEAPGRLTLHRPGVDRGSSTARRDVAHRFHADSALSTETIDVVALDSCADALVDVGLVKIAVEGLELRVLKGAAEVLRRNDLPKLIVGCWSHEWYSQDKDALVDFLDELGYHVVPISRYVDILLAEKKR